MSEQIINTVSRRAADAVSRRTSFLALGGMALAAMTAAPSVAKGGNGRKSGKRRKKRKTGGGDTAEQLIQAKCASQGDQCRASVTELCRGDSNCLEALACCDFFATCDAPAGLRCITA